jgi:hypothetical protein
MSTRSCLSRTEGGTRARTDCPNRAHTACRRRAPTAAHAERQIWARERSKPSQVASEQSALRRGQSFVRNPTHAPGGTSSPPCGFCACTTAVAPTGSPSGTPSSSITVSLLSSTIRIASGSRSPVTSGTSTVGSPVLTHSATLRNSVVSVVVETAAGSSSSLQAPPKISASAVTARIAALSMHA